MILISHRGNVNSVNSERENTEEYIDEAIKFGYNVEIDVWLENNGLYLGHDAPQYPVDISFFVIRKDFLWVHAKNFRALSYFIGTDIRVFFHEKEKHTIIANSKNIWSHDLSEADYKSVIPLLSKLDMQNFGKYLHVSGICSDFVGDFK